MTLTEQKKQELRVLEFIHRGDPAGTCDVSIGGVEEHVGDAHRAREVISTLRENNLIKTDGRLSAGLGMTSLGRSIVEDMLQKRSDRGRRRSLARDQFLQWVDDSSDRIGDRVLVQDFDGEADLLAFTETEVANAVDHLVEAGMLRSVSRAMGHGTFIVSITQTGSDCIDYGQGVAAFQDRRNPPTVQQQVFHMGGENNTFANAIGAHSSATANVTTNDLQAALQIARAVRDASSLLNLPEAAEEALREIEQADDPSLVERGLGRLFVMLNDTSSGAVGGVIASYITARYGMS